MLRCKIVYGTRACTIVINALLSVFLLRLIVWGTVSWLVVHDCWRRMPHCKSRSCIVNPAKLLLTSSSSIFVSFSSCWCPVSPFVTAHAERSSIGLLNLHVGDCVGQGGAQSSSRALLVRRSGELLPHHCEVLGKAPWWWHCHVVPPIRLQGLCHWQRTWQVCSNHSVNQRKKVYFWTIAVFTTIQQPAHGWRFHNKQTRTQGGIRPWLLVNWRAAGFPTANLQLVPQHHKNVGRARYTPKRSHLQQKNQHPKAIQAAQQRNSSSRPATNHHLF